jgi:hypothetical protein
METGVHVVFQQKDSFIVPGVVDSFLVSITTLNKAHNYTRGIKRKTINKDSNHIHKLYSNSCISL